MKVEEKLKKSDSILALFFKFLRFLFGEITRANLYCLSQSEHDEKSSRPLH